jgi:hypothetical protein
MSTQRNNGADPKWDGQPYIVEGFRNRDGEPTLPFDPPNPAALEAAWPDRAIWPRELQAPSNFVRKGGSPILISIPSS